MSDNLTERTAPQNPPENKMGHMPIGKLLISMSLPMMASMLIQALYNIVDSMFVAQLSETALTAVTLFFPVQNLMIGICTGTGVGVNAFLSKSLGEKNYDSANKTATNSIFLATVGFIAFAIVGAAFARSYFTMQTDIPEIIEFGTTYMVIRCICGFGTFYQIAFEKLLQATGRTVYSMLTQILGAVINIILDPIMIFGYFGFPAMGVAGAALATVIGQVASCALAIYLNARKNHDIKLQFKGFRPDGWIIRRIYSIGVPSLIMTCIGSITNLGMNQILLSFTATATAVFGVFFNIQSFVFMPVFGLNNGMVPIIAFNYGARNPKRIKETIYRSVLYATIIMLIGLAVFWIFPKQLLGIYNASETMLAIGVPAFRTVSLSFVFAGFCIVTLSVLQAMGHGFLSLFVSAIRQAVIILPAAYLFSRLWGLNMLWVAYPVAEIITALLCLYFIRKIFKKDIAPLAQPVDPAEPPGRP